MGFKDTINPLDSTSSFYDWFTKENDQIIAKLNQADVASILAGDGITASDTDGVVTISMSGKFDGGISFNGPVYFNGSVPGLPNISVRIDEINSTVGGYTFGTPVRVYYDIDTGNQIYEPAKANDPDQAEVLGVVSEITDQYAYVTMLGRIQGDFTEVNERGIGLTAGWVYFLSPGSTGMVTDVEPFAGGQVSKPVLMGITANEALVLHMRGNYLNPSVPGICGADRILLVSSDDIRDYKITDGGSLDGKSIIDVGSFVSIYTFNTNPTIGFPLKSEYEVYLENRIPHVEIQSEAFGFNKTYLLPAISTESEGITGSVIVNGTEISTLRSYTNDGDHFIGMIEKIENVSSLYFYTIVTNGISDVSPRLVNEIDPEDVNQDIQGIYYLNPNYSPLINTSTGFNGKDILLYVSTTIDSSLQQNNLLHKVATKLKNKTILSNQKNNIVSTINSVNRNLSSNNIGSQYLINGNFNVWQRNIGKGLTYNFTGNIAFADLWKRHDGVTGSDSTKDYYIIRREFNEYQNQIEGSPNYYIDIKALGASAIGYTMSGVSYDSYDHMMIGHIIPDAKRFDGTSLNVKFYAKCSHADYTVDAYFSRYSGTQLLDYINLGALDLTTNWQLFNFNTIVPTLEDKGYSLDINNDYCEIGIDLIPLMDTANNNLVGITQNVYVSLSAVSATSGTSGIPNSVYLDYEEQLKYCQKFYYSSYGKDELLGSITMIDSVNPAQNTESIFVLPNKSCNIFKWPIEMRISPAITFYSPLTGGQNDAYNKNAGFDLKNTSGTIGYNSQIRAAPSGQTTINGSSSKYGVNVCILNGAVNYDEIFYHIIADADFEL